jgi:hypothetical protein
MTKYSVAVTAGGTMVCPQIRTMRLNSRMMMVLKPIHSVSARDSHALRSLRGGGLDAAVDQADEQLLEPIDLVAHAVDGDPLRETAARKYRSRLCVFDISISSV